jgi:hypothetical protein
MNEDALLLGGFEVLGADAPELDEVVQVFRHGPRIRRMVSGTAPQQREIEWDAATQRPV